MTCNNCPNANSSLCCHQAIKPVRQPLARIEDIKPAIVANIDQHKAEWSNKYGPSIFEELERRGEL